MLRLTRVVHLGVAVGVAVGVPLGMSMYQGMSKLILRCTVGTKTTIHILCSIRKSNNNHFTVVLYPLKPNTQRTEKQLLNEDISVQC